MSSSILTGRLDAASSPPQNYRRHAVCRRSSFFEGLLPFPVSEYGVRARRLYEYLSLSIWYQTVCSGIFFLWCSSIHSIILGTDQYPPLSISFASASNMEVSHLGLPFGLPPLLVFSASLPPLLYLPTQWETHWRDTMSRSAMSERFSSLFAAIMIFNLSLCAASDEVFIF